MSSLFVGAGTFAGLVEKLDYLEKLGINAVELLPSQEFNELEYYSVSASVTPTLPCGHLHAYDEPWLQP